MARARNIKPGLFKNELLVEQPLFVRLLFIGLWTLADREGRLEDRPKRIKLELFPYDSEDTDAALQALADNGFIERYEADGKKVIQITNFLKHQTPHGTERDSELPDKDGAYTVHNRNKAGYTTGTKRNNNVKSQENNVGLPGYNSETPGGERPDSPIHRFTDKKIEANASVADKSATGSSGGSSGPNCPADEIISLYHELMPLNPAVKVLSEARRKTIRARWKEAAGLDCNPFGYTDRAGGIAAWRKFFEICAESDFLTGKSQPQPGRPPFIADIDFLMSPSGFTKCLENKYHREAA